MSHFNKTGGPAFPCGKQILGEEDELPAFEGMTLRDYFAAKALPAVYMDLWEDVRAGRDGSVPEDWKMGVAIDAYALADAMLKARKK